MRIETCPRCSSKLGAPLSSGRQVCASCGWSTAPASQAQSPDSAASKSVAPKGGLGELLRLCFRIIRRTLNYGLLWLRQGFEQLVQKRKTNQPRPGQLLRSLNERLSSLEEAIPTQSTLNAPPWMTPETAFTTLGGEPENLWSEIHSRDGAKKIKFNNFKALTSAAELRAYGLEYSQERRDANKPWLRMLPPN